MEAKGGGFLDVRADEDVELVVDTDEAVGLLGLGRRWLGRRRLGCEAVEALRDERKGRRRRNHTIALDEIRLADRAEPALRRLQQTLAARRRGVEVRGDAGARVLQERRERRAAEALADAAPRRGLLGLELLELGVGERLSGREAEPAVSGA